MMKSIAKKCWLVFLLILVSVSTYADDRQEIRVGIFQMNPLNFTDDEGTPQGLYPDLLRKIGQSEHWKLLFVPGSWGQCYDRLMNGEIDLITTVAFSAERAKVFDYNREAVADIWGKVYTRPGSGIVDLKDLNAKKVAIARKDINGKNFLITAKRLGVEPIAEQVESHYEILKKIADGTVDAGVVPQHFGFREAAKYNLVPTTIEFEPFSVFFAVKKNHNAYIIADIDKHLVQWKKDPDSFYFERIAHWMGGSDIEREVVPKWIYFTLLSIAAGLALLAIHSAHLKRQVKLRTKEIADREARFRTLSETTRAVPWELDIASGKFTYVGPRIVDLFGFPVEYWVDMESWANVIHPDDRKWAVDFCMLETSKGQDHDFVYRGICQDGRERWVHDIVAVSAGEKGPEKLYGYFVDITELREHEERFHKMFQEHNAVMLLVDPDTQEIVDANQSACTFYGYQREQIISLPINKINNLSMNEAREAMQQIKEKRKSHFEFRHTLSSGEIRDVEIYSSPIAIKGHALLFSIVHDITERKHAEGELAKYRENLESLVDEQTDKLKEAHSVLLQQERLATLGKLTATVSHELRNPLGTIKTALFSIEDSFQRHGFDKALRPLELAERSIDRCVSIIEELNSFARVKELNISEECFDDWLNGVVGEQDIPGGIDLHLNLSSGIKVLFDQEKLRQVVVNLINNAVHALLEKNQDEKILKISSCLYEGKCEFSVCDNGIGMSDETRSNVFEPLYSTKGFGVGLGMVVVKNIVERHLGEINIDSRQGAGTIVTVRLPASS